MVHYLHQLAEDRRRRFAVDCWVKGDRSPAKAGSLFSDRYPPGRQGNPKATAKFCQYWGGKHDRGEPLQDQRGGGHFKVSRKLALKASRIYKKGLPRCDLPFRSVKHALANSQQLRSIQQQCGNCSAKTLKRAMKRHDPHLTTETIWFKSALRPASKAERLTNARWNLQKEHNNPVFWQRCIFGDGHTVPLPPRTHWTGAGDDRHPRQTTRCHPLLSSTGAPTKKAVVYGAINAVVGAVDLVFCTGTSDLDCKFEASVGAHWWHSPEPAGAHVLLHAASHSSSSSVHLRFRP
jgi:hypothetical protein